DAPTIFLRGDAHMILRYRSRRDRLRSRNCGLRPEIVPLEERALLSAAMPHHPHHALVSAQVRGDEHQVYQSRHQRTGPTITLLNTVTAGGFTFTNFDGPVPGTNAGAGANMNGMSNGGTSVGFVIDNNGNLHNFTTTPLRSRSATLLNINGSM